MTTEAREAMRALVAALGEGFTHALQEQRKAHTAALAERDATLEQLAARISSVENASHTLQLELEHALGLDNGGDYDITMNMSHNGRRFAVRRSRQGLS